MLRKLAAAVLVPLLLAAGSVLAASQDTSLFLRLRSILTGTGDLAAAKSDLSYERTIALASGTGADQANQVWSDTRTLTTGASETLDLNASLTNAVGESVTFTKIKMLMIRSRACTTTLSVGAAAATQFVSYFGSATDVVKVLPGGILLLTSPDATGAAVAAGSTDSLKIANSAGASCDYDIVLVGVN